MLSKCTQMKYSRQGCIWGKAQKDDFFTTHTFYLTLLYLETAKTDCSTQDADFF